MTTKIVFQLDGNGYYVGETTADESPLEPGVFLIPAGCIEEPPPPPIEGKLRRYFNGEWIYEDMPPPELPPDPTTVDPAVEARARRNALLQASDWTQLPDVPILNKEVWATYRQALRDVPQQATFPDTIDWPTSP
jgi:hypothetical protein